MDGDQTWRALVDVSLEIHADLMREVGMVLWPTLFALRGGCLVGYVHLRPITVGQDAAAAIAEMSYLAAPAHADEIMAAWETQDVAAAYDHVPLHPDSASTS
ncbi:hypothetical protein [Spongiactinospora sp. TRM90649]|uniref:hypothetical protein n=1 Tax=Spongiactinospora sp. TRM90649 TaxID=3031114 RepID=UPI0023F9C6DA|nr:hypothetical protein [Spongiactinospora sp. TRM90649]MDF5751020.1 hypothetical protein [Spongiactinospora sp. TRM90649]